MRRILLIVTAVLLGFMLSYALAGCRKSSGNKGGGDTCRPLLEPPY
jgi:hypothetical protein